MGNLRRTQACRSYEAQGLFRQQQGATSSLGATKSVPLYSFNHLYGKLPNKSHGQEALSIRAKVSNITKAKIILRAGGGWEERDRKESENVCICVCECVHYRDRTQRTG